MGLVRIINGGDSGEADRITPIIVIFTEYMDITQDTPTREG